ncbi:MAG: LamG domain-containing protein, partial [Deltaproteobacteria bacterium]
GVPPDSGVPPDAGFVDAGVPPDGGAAPDGGAVPPVPFVPDAVQQPGQWASLNAGAGQALSSGTVAPGSPLDTSAFTIAVWGQQPPLYTALAHRWDEGGQVWWLGNVTNGAMSFGLAQSTSGAGGFGRDFATPVYAGEWHHFVVTYDQGVIHTYLDGLNDDGAVFGPVPTSVTGGNSPMYLGQSYLYDGPVASAAYFDRALDPLEVQQVFCTTGGSAQGCWCGTAQSCAPADLYNLQGLVCHWPLAGDATDATGTLDLIEINGPVTYAP